MEVMMSFGLCLCLLVSMGLSTTTKNCQCVPDQWQGVLASVEREFDLVGGRSAAAENNIYVHYDYLAKTFAMVDMTSGSKAIANYVTGYKYVIRGDMCHGMRTTETMRKMCLPDHAEYLGKYTLGTDLPVDIWQFGASQNVSMRTTVVRKNCMPLSEEVYMTQEGYASLTSSLYLDVTMGISDRSVFEPPENCMVDRLPPRTRGPYKKRMIKRIGDNPFHLLHAMKNRMYMYS